MVLPGVLVIPDLEQLYEAVDDQIEKLNEDIEQLDEDVFFENMSEKRVKRWETMLSLTPKDTDSLDERRFAVQTRVVDKLPYSYRIILSDLHALDPEATMEIDWETLKVIVRIALSSSSMVGDVHDLLEKKLPLNMIYEIIIMYNTNEQVAVYTHDQLSAWTHDYIKSSTDI